MRRWLCCDHHIPIPFAAPANRRCREAYETILHHHTACLIRPAGTWRTSVRRLVRCSRTNPVFRRSDKGDVSRLFSNGSLNLSVTAITKSHRET